MPILQFPPQPISGSIRDEIAAACEIPAPYVDVFEDRLEVVGMVNESMRPTIEQVLAAHVPVAQLQTVDPDATLTAGLLNLRGKAPTQANWDVLIDVLTGAGDRPAQVAGKAKEN